MVGLFGLAQLLTFPVPEGNWRSLLAVVLDLAGATLLAVTSVQLVRAAIARTERTEEHVRRLEAHLRNDRTLIHEVSGTIAGISAASRLLSVAAPLAPAERQHLEELLASETARVDRLLAEARTGSSSGEIAPVDLTR